MPIGSKMVKPGTINVGTNHKKNLGSNSKRKMKSRREKTIQKDYLD